MRNSHTNQPKIAADLSCNLIQSIRLIHAVAEADAVIVLPQSEAWKFGTLKEEFGMQFVSGKDTNLRLSDYASFSHDVPVSRIGDICRPLIFPHAITSHCRVLWSPIRRHKYAFAGLMSNHRRLTISQWLGDHFSVGRVNLLWHWSRVRLLSKAAEIPLGGPGKLVIDASLRGRQFPEKCWDKTYYQLLANSKFVLCPSGDFVWTYRFFEAILCGAIPIVEESCPAYEGFQFIKLSDSPNSVTWSLEIAEFNYRLCVQRITVPLHDLNCQLNAT
jgi:hypothetical protein